MKKLIVILLWGVTAAATTPTIKTVITKKIVSQEMFDVLSYPARVDSKVNAAILSEADGVVTRIFKNIGENVKRGNKIVVLEHTDPLYNYAPLAATSPVDGVVSLMKVTIGSRVAKGEQLAAVTDPNKIQLTIEVASLDLPIFQKAPLGELTVPGTDKPVAVKVARLSPFADPATGTASCELEFVNAKDKLPPGFVGHVSFKINARQAIVLPEYAIFYKGDDSFVRLVTDGKAKKVAVKLGHRQRGQVEILSGLKPDDVVIERASGFLSDGDAVKIEAETKTNG